MKIKIAADAFRPAAEEAAALAPGTHVRPILETVLLTTDDAGVVTVSATDFMSVTVWFRLECDETEAGSLCIPSVNLLRIVKKAGKRPLTISWDGVAPQATVSFEGTRASLPVENPSDYPDIKRFDDSAPCVSVPTAMLIKMLKRAIFATASDFKARILAGVRFQVTKKRLKLTASDGIRMSSVQCDIENPSGTTVDAVTLPFDPKHLLRIAEATGNVDIQMHEKFLRLRGTRGERLHNTISGNFPNYDLEKQLNLTKMAAFKTADLRDALERAVLLKAKGLIWEFTFDGDRMQIRAVSGLDGSLDAETPVTWGHDKVAMRLSPEYLLEAVKVVDKDEVELDLESPRQPVRLREADGSFLFLYALGAQV